MRTECLCLLLLATGSVAAQSGGEFEIPRSTIEGGGVAAGGAFEMAGAIAQPDADPQSASGGAFSLRGGFFVVGAQGEAAEAIFADGFETPGAGSRRTSSVGPA